MQLKSLPHVLLALALCGLTGCASKPMNDYSVQTPGMALLPISQSGLGDERGRFREIYCAINAARGKSLPDYRPCDDALVRLPGEALPSGRPVNLGKAARPLTIVAIPGVGWTCFRNWLEPQPIGAELVSQYSYTAEWLELEALSGTELNARLLRDAIMARAPAAEDESLILLGYSKGASDILEAITAYPELAQRVTAVISVAGAIGGSPLANHASQTMANLLTHFPGSDCEVGDEAAVESLTTAVRQRWLATHRLPESIRYYSLVTYPEPERISSLLRLSYDKLALIDPRNDSQLIFYDQIIPGSKVIGYLNGDHWSIAVPIGRNHVFIGSTLVDQNDFPREVLLEALFRFVDEDLAR